MVYGNGLENRRGVKATESSNLSLSARRDTISQPKVLAPRRSTQVAEGAALLKL